MLALSLKMSKLGKKVMSDNFIPVNTPLLDGNELKYISEAIETGWISSEGPFVNQFEEKFAKSVHREYGVAVANGSAALDIAIAALGISDDDEVIMPTHTIISCASAVVRAGGKPIFVDSDSQAWNMRTDQIEEKITENTKAIMAVHIFGLPVDMDPILSIAKKYSLFVIEDAAQMIGQKYKGQPCGSFGDISTFSFYPNKHITTGEGGMVVTNEISFAEKSRSYRNLCFQEKKRFVHEELGWNYRMTNIQAALGLAQLETLNSHIEKKRMIGKKYNHLLQGVSNIHKPLEKCEYAANIYWVYGVMLDSTVGVDADRVRSQLAKRGIGTRPFFWPMHEQPVFLKRGWYKNEKYPFAEIMARRGFYIPSGLGISDAEIERVSEAVIDVMQEYM